MADEAKAATSSKPEDRGQGAIAKQPPQPNLADQFRSASQAVRLKSPEMNQAAKLLAVANGYVDKAYSKDSPQNAQAKEMVKEAVARRIEQNQLIKAPRVIAQDTTNEREPDKGRDR